jgi:hypothetical protein
MPYVDSVFPCRRQRKAETGRALVDVEPHEVCDGDQSWRRRRAGSSRIGLGRLELVSDGRLALGNVEAPDLGSEDGAVPKEQAPPLESTPLLHYAVGDVDDGAPVPPVTGSGVAESRNLYRPSAAQSAASSSRFQFWPCDIPISTNCSAHRQRPDRSNSTHSKVGLSVATTARTWSWNHSTLCTHGPPSPAAHFDLVAPSDHRAGDEIRGERRDHLQPLTPLTIPDHTLGGIAGRAPRLVD